MAEKEHFDRRRPHPWHGLKVGPDPPRLVHGYIEITPFDLVKYEVDKVTGYLRVDRPQRSSSLPPALYGFIPRTYCDENFRKLSPHAQRGDGDPLDICVISERPIRRGEILLDAWVVGGLQMIDYDEADDKIIGVLYNDPIWGEVRDISELPPNVVERLHHYFSTYKMIPGEKLQTAIDSTYGAEHARKVVEASMLDYDEKYGQPE